MWCQESSQATIAAPIKEMKAPMSFCRGVSSSFLSTIFFPILMKKRTTSTAIQMNDNIPNHIVNKLFYSGTKIRIYSDSCAAARDFFVSSMQSTHNWSTTSCVSSSVMVPMKSIIVSRAICCSRGVAPSSTSVSTALSNSSRFMGQQVMVTQILYPLTQIAM